MRELLLTDIDFLYEWNRSVLCFMSELIEGKENASNAADKEIVKSVTESLDHVKSENNLRGMRMIFNDMREWAGSLTTREQQKLTEILDAEFGPGTARFKEPR